MAARSKARPTELMIGTPTPLPLGKAKVKPAAGFTLSRDEVAQLMAQRSRTSTRMTAPAHPDAWIMWLADLSYQKLMAIHAAEVATEDEVKAAIRFSLQWVSDPTAVLALVRSGWLSAEDARADLRKRAGVVG
jgi:hypothetical protein